MHTIFTHAKKLIHVLWFDDNYGGDNRSWGKKEDQEVAKPRQLTPPTAPESQSQQTEARQSIQASSIAERSALKKNISINRGKISAERQGESIAAKLRAYGDGRRLPKNLGDVNPASLLRMIGNLGIGGVASIVNQSQQAVNSGSDWQKTHGEYDYPTLKKLISSMYTSNGAFGQEEADAVYGFMKYYANPGETAGAKKEIDRMAQYYKRGYDATQYEQDVSQIDSLQDTKDSLVNFLTDTYSGSVRADYLRTILGKYLGKPQNVATLARALGIIGGNTISDVTRALRADPTLKPQLLQRINEGTRFLQQTRKRGFSLSETQLDQILKGELMAPTSETRGLEREAIGKMRDAIDRAKGKANELTGTEKQSLLQAIKDVEKNQRQLAQGLLRYTGAGVGANIGKGANAVGVGASFATPLDQLSVNIGAGMSASGRVGGGLIVRLGDTIDISETNDKRVTGSGGVSAGVGLAGGAFIGVDAGLKVTDRVNTFGGGGFQNAKSQGVDIYANSAGAVGIAYSRMDNRLETIEDYGRKLEGALSQVAPVTQGDLSDRLRTGLTGAGLKIENDSLFRSEVSDIREFMTRNNLWDKDSATQTLGLLTYATGKIEQYKLDEGSNTKEEMSFGGWSIGAGHFLGVTFPTAGFTWYRVNTDYVDPGEQSPELRQSGSGAIDMTEGVGNDVSLPHELNTPQMRAFILRARKDPTFRKFQRELTDGDREEARRTLENYAKRVQPRSRSMAQNLLHFVNNNSDADLSALSRVNELTSGDNLSRRIGEMDPKQAREFIRGNTREVQKMLQGRQRTAEEKFGGKWDDMYSVENLLDSIDDTPTYPLRVTSNRKFFGSIDYHQTLGGARGLDQLSQNTPLYGAEKVGNATDREKKMVIQSLKQTRPNLWQSLKTKIGGSDQNLTDILLGKTTELDDGKALTVTRKPDYYRGMSGVVGATCFNATVFMTLPEVNGEAIFEQIIPTQELIATQENFSIGVSSRHNKKPKQVERPTTKPEVKPPVEPPTPPVEPPVEPPTPPVEPPTPPVEPPTPPVEPPTPEPPTPPVTPPPPTPTPSTTPIIVSPGSGSTGTGGYNNL